MYILDKYILSEWLKYFGICLIITVGLIVLEDMYNDLPSMIRFGAHGSQVLKYYGYLIPSFFPTIIPLSFLASLIYSLGNLHRNNEITAMRAAGIHIIRITRTLWIAGIFLAICLFFLNSYWVPKSVERARNFYDKLSFSYKAKTTAQDNIGVIYNLTFNNSYKLNDAEPSSRLWFFNRYSQYTRKGHGVTVYAKNSLGQETYRITAKMAFFDAHHQQWVFLEGRQITFDPETQDPIRALKFTELAMPEFQDDPGIMEIIQKKAQDLSYNEINTLLNYLPKDAPSYRHYSMAKHQALCSPFSCIIILAVGIPFIVTGVRANPLIGISKTVALVFIYYLLNTILANIGEQGHIPIIIAAWLPFFILLITAYPLCKKI